MDLKNVNLMNYGNKNNILSFFGLPIFFCDQKNKLSHLEVFIDSKAMTFIINELIVPGGLNVKNISKYLNSQFRTKRMKKPFVRNYVYNFKKHGISLVSNSSLSKGDLYRTITIEYGNLKDTYKFL